MTTYRDLIVWKKSMDLTADVYRLVKCFPKDEAFGLISQLRRASVSIPANIAEGYGRNSTADYLKFLRYAHASGYEVQTLLEIAVRVGYTEAATVQKLLAYSGEIERMLSTMIRNIAKNPRT